MAKKTVKRRDWTKEDIGTLKALAGEKTKTTVIARRLKRSVGATYQRASKLGVSLGAPRKRRRGRGSLLTAVAVRAAPNWRERRQRG